MTYRENQTELQPDRSILVVAMHGLVAGLDRHTGEIRWRNDLRGGGKGEVFLAIAYGVVVVSAIGSKIYCLDYLSGDTRWEQTTSGGGRATILMESDRIVCAKGGYLDCFDPSGRKLWSQPMSGFGLGSAALGFPGNVAQADDTGP